MPTYEYRCNACGHEFELFQQMSEAVKRKCPKCAKAKLERLIGAGAGIIFKGGGFYQTDYRSDSYKKAAESETKINAAPANNSDTAPAMKPTDSVAASSTPPATNETKPVPPKKPKATSRKGRRP